MKKIYTATIWTLVLVMLLALTGGVVADTLRKTIQAIEAKDMYLKYNGDEFIARDGNDKVVYPIVVNGTSYLPLRAVSSIAGLKVDWDGGTRTISLTSSDYMNVDDDGYVEELEINDTKADANLIQDVNNGKVKGRVGTTTSAGKDNVDMFKFTLPENGVFTFDITGNKSAAADVTIRDDSNGYDIAYYFNGADPDGMYSGKLALRAGVYYIELDGSDEEMPYKIKTSFRATPDDHEKDDSESDAKVFTFDGSKFVNQGAVGAGNDIYNDYVILKGFDSNTYTIDFAWSGQKYDYVYVDFYDKDGYSFERKEFPSPVTASNQVITETLSGQFDTVIDKIVIYIDPSDVDAICTEYTVTIQK